MKITAIAHVGDEGPFLLEWIAFNRIIGVTDLLIYSADSDDGTQPLLDALQKHGIVQHVRQSSLRRRIRSNILRHARRNPIVSNADWVWIANVEEFLNIHTRNGTIPELIAACDNPLAISLNYQYFANDDVQDFTDTPVIGQFMHSHNPDLWCENMAIEVKSLIHKDFPLKSDDMNRPFCTADRRLLPIWKDGSGRHVPNAFLTAANPRRIRRFPASGARRFATLNRYALRSLDSFLVKGVVGDISGEGQKYDTTYWQERNDDGYYDDSILRYLPRLNTELSALKSIAEIEKLHQDAVKRHCIKIEQLMKDRTFVSLRSRLLTSPKSSQSEAALMDQLSRSIAV